MSGNREALGNSSDQSLEDLLQATIRARDLVALREFLALHPDAPHFRIEPLGDTALHIAIGWREGTDLLLQAGADINAVSHRLDLTPLRKAIAYTEPAHALYLLEQGADPHIASVPQKTTMQLAARSGAVEVVQALRARGVPLDIFAAVTLEDIGAIGQLGPSVLGQRTRTHEVVTIRPLHLAALQDRPGMIDALLAAGANPDDRDELGRTPMDLALHSGKRKAYERLAANGCMPNPELLALVGSIERSERIARLHSALFGGNVRVVEAELDADQTLLNQHFPDVWATGGTYGATPLHWAAMSGQLEVARLLLSRGASLDARDLTHNGRPIGWAEQYRRREMVALLIAHGSEPVRS